jgi:hypothetical protein
LLLKKKFPRDVIEGKESKTLHAPVKNQQKMFIAPNGRGTPMIVPRPCPCQELSADVKFVSVLAMVLSEH